MSADFPGLNARQEFVARIIRGVCEIPGHSSPDDQPDLVIVDVHDLERVIESAFEHFEERQPTEPISEVSFDAAWQEMKAKGYDYGDDALEQVRLGWMMHRGHEAKDPTP